MTSVLDEILLKAPPVPPIKRVRVEEPRVVSPETFARMLKVHVMQSDPYNMPMKRN